MSNVKKLSSRFMIAGAFLLLMTGQSWAADLFQERKAFEKLVAGRCEQLHTDFTDESGTVSELFNGLVKFDSTAPSTFSGGWNAHGTVGGPFKGHALAAEPRHSGSTITMIFANPVYAVGFDIFDDIDRGVNTVTVQATDSMGSVSTFSESVTEVGYVGFVGFSSLHGLTRVEVSIDDSGANHELDNLIIVPRNCCRSRRK